MFGTIAVLGLLALQGKPSVVKEIVSPGKGLPAQVGDRLSVIYTGKLLNGKQFDSNVGKAPFVITLGTKRVIAGWEQGLLGTREDEKLKLTIPPALGYGERGAGSDIPPNSTLVFTIEVLRIERKGAPVAVEITETKAGSGAAVKAGDTVTIHYTGKFLNGVKFDSSLDRNEPFKFKVAAGQVVPGFDKAVMGLRKGGKRSVIIPPSLAYGSRGAGGVIPPDSTLVFEVELVDIETKPSD